MSDKLHPNAEALITEAMKDNTLYMYSVKAYSILHKKYDELVLKHEKLLRDSAAIAEENLELHESTESVRGRRFDLVIANLDLPTIGREHRSLVSSLSPAGRLVLSGILEENIDETQELFPELRLSRKAVQEHWACLELEHPEG